MAEYKFWTKLWAPITLCKITRKNKQNCKTNSSLTQNIQKYEFMIYLR